MKKYFIICTICILSLCNISGYAASGIAFFAGLSTPNDKMSSVYNKDKVFSKALDQDVNFLKNAASHGYHLGAKILLPMSENFVLHGGLAWNRFPGQILTIKDDAGKEVANLELSQDIIPISAGLHYYLLNTSFAVYALGEISYNYNKNSVNYSYNGIGVPLDLKISNEDPGYSRIGAGFGAGVELDIWITKLFLEAKYNFMNIIAKDEGEPLKSYLTVSLGLRFGGTPK